MLWASMALLTVVDVLVLGSWGEAGFTMALKRYDREVDVIEAQLAWLLWDTLSACQVSVILLAHGSRHSPNCSAIWPPPFTLVFFPHTLLQISTVREYWGTEGLVSLADIVEEMVG